MSLTKGTLYLDKGYTLAEGLAEGKWGILKDLVRDDVISIFEAAERLGISPEEFKMELDK